MIDNFALFVTHMTILYLMWRLIRTPDPDEQRAPRLDPRRRRRAQDDNPNA